MKKFLLSFLALLLLVEEWLWDLLSACAHYLIALLRLEGVERWLIQTSPNMALCAFMVPVLLVTPINLAAIWFFIHGLLLQGLATEIFAKLLGTLLIARIFTLTKPQLLSFKFINLIYTTITGWLRWAHNKVVDTAVYRYGKQLKAEIKARVEAFWSK